MVEIGTPIAAKRAADAALLAPALGAHLARAAREPAPAAIPGVEASVDASVAAESLDAGT